MRFCGGANLFLMGNQVIKSAHGYSLRKKMYFSLRCVEHFIRNAKPAPAREIELIKIPHFINTYLWTHYLHTSMRC